MSLIVCLGTKEIELEGFYHLPEWNTVTGMKTDFGLSIPLENEEQYIDITFTYCKLEDWQKTAIEALYIDGGCNEYGIQDLIDSVLTYGDICQYSHCSKLAMVQQFFTNVGDIVDSDEGLSCETSAINKALAGSPASVIAELFHKIYPNWIEYKGYLFELCV